MSDKLLNNIVLHEFESREELDQHLAEKLVKGLDARLSSNAQASIAISGGSTPKGLFKALSLRDINWSLVDVTLIDDRVVPEDHQDSNEKLAKENLLINFASEAKFHSLLASVADGSDIRELSELDIAWPLSVAILGMGNDGHTASWFPDAPELQEALCPSDSQTLMYTHPKAAPHKRATLTLPAVLNSDLVIVHICGEDKKAVLEQALQEGAVEQLPIRAILKQTTTPVEIYWAP